MKSKAEADAGGYRGGAVSTFANRPKKKPTLYVVLHMPAIRTQVYLTKEQRQKLDSRRRRERKTLAAVVRDAIDAYVGKEMPADLRTTLDETFGVAPKFTVPSRNEWGQRARRVRA